MRNALAAILAIIVTLSLCACGGTEAVPSGSQETLSSQVDISTTASNEAATTDAVTTEVTTETTTEATTETTTEATTEDTTTVHTHSFSDGTCVTCGTADPDYEQATNVWIPTNGGKKYHKNDACSNMKNPEQVTKSEAESRGFTPCKRCY